MFWRPPTAVAGKYSPPPPPTFPSSLSLKGIRHSYAGPHKPPPHHDSSIPSASSSSLFRRSASARSLTANNPSPSTASLSLASLKAAIMFVAPSSRRPLPPSSRRSAAFLLYLSILLTLAFLFFYSQDALPSFPLLSASTCSILPIQAGSVASLHPLRNMIMVAGHSVYTADRLDMFHREESWQLEPYQRVKGIAGTLVDHIREGVLAAAEDESALLLFSGGQSRQEAGPRSEAQSYWMVAEKMQWLGHLGVASRAYTEEYARDSFENVLFSICRFREITGHYPHNITVVSYSFKNVRFVQMHRIALSFPQQRFFFIGTPIVPESIEGAVEGERRTKEAFKLDPYGCIGELRKKKLKRDPFARTIPYPLGCPELRSLFLHCGPRLFRGSLPWAKRRSSRRDLG